MYIVKYKFVFIGIAVLMAAFAVFRLATVGIKQGIDFTGGTVVEVRVAETSTSTLDMGKIVIPDVHVYRLADGVYKFVSTLKYDVIHAGITSQIQAQGLSFTETQVNQVGPSMGAEMTKKATIAFIAVALAVILFIAFSFRKVSLPVASWKYGVVAMVTLVHDMLVPAGVYTYLSRDYGAEVDTLFIIALLTVLAVSISDKIVVFDRIRENLATGGKQAFDVVVGHALTQTFTRSVNTSMTTILSLVALIAFGPDATKFFAITLLVGLVVGTYSSIFVASPFLIVWNSMRKSSK